MPAAGRREPKRQRMTNKLRDQFEPFYADHHQSKDVNYWPPVGLMNTKKRTSVKPLPPVGMNILDPHSPIIAWVDPVGVHGLRDWVEQACTHNAALMLSEFRQENRVRYFLGVDNVSVMLHNNVDVLHVKASTFFGRNVIRYGSWSFYCKLLVYMHENGFNLGAIEGAVDWSKRSHVLMFMSSYLPLSYIQSKPRITLEDKDNMTDVIVDCMEMFVAVRTALFGVGRNYNGIEPHEQYIGEMIINTDNNATTRLQETLRLSTAARFICTLPYPVRLRQMLDESWHDELTPRLMLEFLGMKQKVAPLVAFDEAQRIHNSEQPAIRNLDVINIKQYDFLNGIRSIVFDVFGRAPWMNVSFSMRTLDGEINMFELPRLSKALCLLQLAFGARYVGVLLHTKVMPVGDYLRELGVDSDDYSVFSPSDQVILNLPHNKYDRLAIANIPKQNKDFSVRCLLSDLFDPAFVLDDWLDRVSVEMQAHDLAKHVPMLVFFRLLSAVRDAVFDVFRDVEIEWNEYDVHIENETISGIKYINTRDEDTLVIRKMKSFLYASVNEAAKSIAIEGMHTVMSTHELRRLHATYSYYVYGRRRSMTKTEFVRVIFGHKNGAARHYTALSIVD